MADTSTEIHRGTRNIVFRVSNPDGRSQVLKMVQPGLEAAPLSRAGNRLRHEHAMLQFLNAKGVPGIVRVLGLADAGRIPRLLLDDAGPRNLTALLRQAPLAPGAFLDAAIQLAHILVGLHAQQVVHRNINPSNIIVADDGRLTLVDLALATRVAGFARTDSQLAGTLAYLAPEQTGRVDRPVDHRSDLYALGATFYEMLTGAPPFSSADPAELLHAHLARLPISPSERNPAVPELLSSLVLRLLSKAPEQRYQAAEALLADLDEARRRWQATLTIAPFELGRLDLARGLLPVTGIYGRQSELQRLTQAFERCRTGAHESVVLRGPSGVGKSTLIRDWSASAGQLANVVTGKFDVLRSEVPYGAVLEALGGFVRGLARQPAPALELARRRIHEALGPNLGVLASLIPELVSLMGSAPPVPTAGPVETANRLYLCFHSFVQAFASADLPLVLILDDLHWADGASLSLIEYLLCAADLHHVMFLGATRNERVGPQDALEEALNAVERAGSRLALIELAPLDDSALQTLCEDALRCGPERAAPMAELLRRKTAGNPLFVERFLTYLHQAGLLTFDLQQGEWQWDLEQLNRATVTENVVELMILTIGRLPPDTQQLLRAASCFPGQIQLAALAGVTGRSVDESAASLWAVVSEGLLVPERSTDAPLGTDMRTSSSDWGTEGDVDSSRNDICYRFAHDRVKQAAYSLLPPEEQTRLHLAIGRELLGSLSPRALEEHLFDVVDQLNLGSAALVPGSERIRLAELNLRAARRAVAAASLGPGLAYALQGSLLLPKEPWLESHSLWFALQLKAAECAYFRDERETAERLLAEALPHTANSLEKAQLYELRMTAAWNKHNEHAAALRCGREALELLGQALPETEIGAALAAEMAAILQALQGRAIDDLLELPKIVDPVLLVAMRILKGLTPIAFYAGDPTFFAFVVARTITLSVLHGNAEGSAFAYVCHGMLLDLVLGDRAAGDAFARVGLELARRSGSAEQEAATLSVFGGGWHHWRAPFADSAVLLRRAIKLGVESGDFPMAGSATRTLLMILFHSGAALSRLDAECGEHLKLLARIGQQTTRPLVLALRRAIRALQGSKLNEEPLDLGELAVRNAAETLGLTESFLQRAFERSAEHAANAERIEAEAPSLRVSPGSAQINFSASLTDIALSAGKTAAESAERFAKIAQRQLQMAQWIEGCPENFLHKHQLVAAELARWEGAPLHVLLPQYDAVIAGARRGQFSQDEALANELAGRHCLTLGCNASGLSYLRAARAAFARWGATAKVNALEDEFPELIAPESPAQANSEEFDLLSLSKASEILTSQVALDHLLQKLIAVCLEMAGAERGVLVLEQHGRMVVRATGAVSEPTALPNVALSAAQAPASLVEHVARTGEPLALADAARHGEFTRDPYIAERGVKSALALPIVRHEKTLGVVYLENNLATRAFSAARVRVLRLLSSQIGVALDNSRLFESLNAEQARLSAVIRHVPVGLVIAEAPSGRLLVANDRLEQILPGNFQTSGSIEHYNDYTGYYPDGRRYEPAQWPLARSIRDGEIVHSEEIAIELSDGSRVNTSLSSAPIRDADGNITAAVVILEDITQRKLVEEQLRQSQKMEAIGQLAGGVAHDFNNLLTAINGYSYLGMRQVAETDPVHQFFLEILNAGERAAGLTKQLLAYSRKQILAFKVWPINTIVEDMQPLLKRLITENIELRAVLGENAGLVKVDRGQVEQIIMNLVVNARDAMPNGGRLSLETENVWLDESGLGMGLEVKRGPHVVLRVSDTGSGMDATVKARIFEPFFTTKEVGKGTGLGLAVVFGILKQSGGSVSVRSELGAGTTFYIYLPEVKEPSARTATLSEDETVSSGSETILLVEDDDLVRNFGSQALRALGYGVFEAANGTDALALLRRPGTHVRLVIADVVMPDMGGLALAERLRLDTPSLPIIFISGYSPPTTMSEALSRPGCSFLNKPFSPFELARAVRQALDGAG